MPQKTHIMHGRDHEPHGADPIRGLIPLGGDTLDEKIAALAPAGFWKLNEASGSVAADSSGNDLDMSTTSPELDPDWGQPPGPPDQPTASFDNGTAGPTGTASRVSRTWPELDGDFTAGLWVNRTTEDFSMLMGQGFPHRAGGVDGWALYVHPSTGPGANCPALIWGTSGGPSGIDALNPVAADTWVFLAVTYNATTEVFKLYVEGLLQDEDDGSDYGSAAGERLWIGHDGGDIYSVLPTYAVLSYAFLVNRVVSGDELRDLVVGVGEGGGVVIVGPGDEIHIEPHPGTDVEHGDGEEEENPQTGTGGTGAANGSGWHYNAHYEYVVLYDSNPGRFDVPSRKWVRVPFNTVRIQRTWEPEVGGNSRTAWLADDRGLSDHAKNGTLLVTAGMTFSGGPLALEQEVSGWYSVEYPMLNPVGLPDGGTVGIPDHYARGARMTNTTKGQVLRAGESLPEHPDWRVFFDWPFYSPADGDEGIWFVNSDNPFPFYPVWAARPLNKPLPYPKYTSAESLENYSTPAGNHGFDFADLVSRTFLAAGDAISLQAWQDTPWLLRFGTDRYPPFTPQDYSEKWRKRPCLVVFHYYDPDTVDHDTGVLV